MSEERDVIKLAGHTYDVSEIVQNHPLLLPHLARQLSEIILAYYQASRYSGHERFRLNGLHSDISNLVRHLLPGHFAEVERIDREERMERHHRLLRRMAKKKIPRSMRKAVFERDDYSCVKCGSRFEIACDHVYPESKGGKATLDNLQTLCKSCNSRKGAKVEEESLIPKADPSGSIMTGLVARERGAEI